MLFFQYDVVDVFFYDDMDIDNCAASSIAFVMFASLVSTSVHSIIVVAVIICYQ